MRPNVNTKKYALLGAAASALLIAACSSSASSSAGGPSSAAGGASGSGGSDASGIAAAKAFLDQYQNAPTSIGAGLPPLSKRPAAGKFIVGFNNGGATDVIVQTATAKAAALLGWR